MSNSSQATADDNAIDKLLSMVDTSNIVNVIPTRPADPIYAALENCIASYKALQRATGLSKITGAIGYGLLLTAFLDNNKRNISKDERGEYIKIDGVKIRPVDNNGRAFFYGAVNSIME